MKVVKELICGSIIGLIEIRFILRDQHSSDNTITNYNKTIL